MVDDDLDDGGSTLVRTGKLAMGYQEMVSFVKDIEERPDGPPGQRPRGLAGAAGGQAPTSGHGAGTRPDIGADRSALVGRMRYLRAARRGPAIRSRALAFFEKPAS